MTFKVFFTDGDAIEVAAPNPNAARDIARVKKGGGIITKVKQVRG